MGSSVAILGLAREGIWRVDRLPVVPSGVLASGCPRGDLAYIEE